MPVPTPVQGSGAENGSPRASAVFFGSGAFTFAAFMAMLQAQQEGMNDMAKLAEKTTTERANLVTTLANATQDTYNDDATQLIAQRNEQFSQAAVGFVQGAVAVGTIAGTASANKYSSQMDDLVKNVNEMPKQTATVYSEEGKPPEVVAQQRARAAIVEKYKSQIKNKLFDYKSVVGEGKAGLDEPLKDGNGVTLREVLNSAKNETEREELLKGMGSARKMATKGVMNRQNEVQFYSQIANAAGQTGGGVAGAFFKTDEANAMTKKGGDSAVQQGAQACAQFAQETGKAQNDASDQYNRTSQQVWQSIHEIVQVDTRG